MIWDYILISTRNLFNRRLRSWLTIIGIFIGIAAVVSLIGLGEGLRVAIISQFGFLGTDVLSVSAKGLDMAGAPGTAVRTPLTSDLADKIERLPGVEAALNRYIATGTFEFRDLHGFGFAISIAEGENRRIMYRILNAELSSGRLLRDGDARRVLLGNSFSDKSFLGANRGIETGDRIKLNDIEYEVAGILKKKGSFMIDSAILINEKQLLDDFGGKDEVNIIAIVVEDVNRMDRVKEDIEKLLRKERNVKEGDEDFTVESPQATLDALNDTLFAVQLFVYIIAAISILVGGIGITNTMYTAVLERTKEIGIMKAIGAKNSSIFTIFFIESGALGLVGGIIGVITGAIFAYGLAAIGRVALGVNLIQAQISPSLVIGSLIFSFTIGVIAGIMPALKAAHKHPVDSLRFAK